MMIDIHYRILPFSSMMMEQEHVIESIAIAKLAVSEGI